MAQEFLVGARFNINTIKKGDSLIVPLKKLEEDIHEHGGNHKNVSDYSHVIKIKLLEVKENAVEIEVIINAENTESLRLEFEVSYFDAPLTDNTLLPDKHRFAITLKETNMKTQEATLNVFEFPADFITTGYRPSIREANKMINNIQ